MIASLVEILIAVLLFLGEEAQHAGTGFATLW